MASVNRVFFLGNLTRDVTVKENGVVRFCIAVNERRKNEESAIFLECVAFEKTGEIVSNYCTKGTQVFVEGRLQQNRWTGRDGKEKSELQVVVERVQILSRGREREEVAVGAAAEAAIPF